MKPDELRALADALSSGTHYVESPELHEAMMRAADYLRACADTQPVAWMHIDGRVISAATMDQAYRDGGAMQSSLREYTIPLYTRPAPAVPQDEPSAALIRAYNSGYMQGHHDTVEAQFIVIHPLDMDTYHADVVAELGLTAAPQAEPCIGNDSACPCQDGDACHYKDAADGTKAWPVPQAKPTREPRPCTCHPDDNPPVPCAQKYALNECRATRSGPDEARDALLDFISENGTASEGVQYYLDRYVRAALAAKE